MSGEGIVPDRQWAQAVWNEWANLEHLVSNIARSMTNNIRQTSSADHNAMYAGTAYREEVFINVRWAWLVLPIALVVCSDVFLISSILQTRSNQVKAWKSSALALLFTSVDCTLQRITRDGTDVQDGLSQITSNSRVVLRDKNGSWEFQSLVPESGSLLLP